MDIFKNLQMEMAIKELKSNLPTMIEYSKIVAKQLKAYHEALVKEGFTEDQALEITIRHGNTYGNTNEESE